MITIELKQVSNYVLKNVSLLIPGGSLHVVIGPNGAGKTTLLKVIAGLAPYKGNVLFNGEPVDKKPPWERGIGYLPQTTALFPHMTVLENVLFGLKSRGLSMQEALGVAKHYLELLGIYELRNRYPLTLSGGEQRKVALARALAIKPKILLLDEPFVGIDYDHRIQIKEIIRKVHDQEKPTIILVTHDLDEAIELGQRYTVIISGRITYSGGLRGLLENIRERLHYINAYQCVITEIIEEAGLAKVDCNGVTLTIPVEDHLQTKTKILVTIPADKVIPYMAEKCYPRTNCLKGEIIEVQPWSNKLKLVKVNTKGIRINLITDMEVGRGMQIQVKLPLKDIKTYRI